MKFNITIAQPDQFAAWNSFVEQADNGTLFHRLDFLAYHGDRFTANECHLLFLKGETLFGVLPFALFEENGKKVGRSPYGASYGGPVFAKELRYAESVAVVQELCYFFSSSELDEVIFTLPLQCCHKLCSDTFILALHKFGFECINRDISSIVNLHKKDIISSLPSKVRNKIKKARSFVNRIQMDAFLRSFWPLLEKTFQRHGVTPTHSFDDLAFLQEQHNNVRFEVAWIDDRAAAGICHFIINSQCVMTFYLASDPNLRKYQALSLLIYESMLYFQELGFKWYDFGTSSVQMKARENIFEFKEGFGAIGQFRETYRWKANNRHKK